MEELTGPYTSAGGSPALITHISLSTGLKCRRGQQQLHLDPFQGYTTLNLEKKSPFHKKVSKDLVSPFIYSLLESKNADESIIVRDVIWFSLRGFRVLVS